MDTAQELAREIKILGDKLRPSYKELEQTNKMLKQAIAKWQSDYDLLLSKYELTNERILEG